MLGKIKTFKFFIAFEKTKFFVVAILAFLSAAFEYLTMGLIFNFTNSIFAVENQVPQISNKFFMYLQSMINFLPLQNPFTASCVALSLVVALGACFDFLFYYGNEDLTQSIRRHLQRVLMNRYLEAEYNFFLNRKQGDLLFNILQAPQCVITVLSLSIQILVASLTLGLFLVLLFTISGGITLFVLGLCIIFGYFIVHLSKRIGYEEGKKANNALSALSVSANEFITNIKDVKVNCLGTDMKTRIALSLDKFFKAKMKVVLYRTFINRIFPAVIITSIFVSLILVRKNNAVDFTVLLPAFMVYIAAILKSVPIIKEIGTLSINLSHYYPNLQLLYEEMHTDEANISFDGDREIEGIDTISFEKVTFNYGDKKVLEGVSFNIQRNKTIALVGGSGSGKTTITNLILKLYQPQSGVVRINGIDINEIKRTSLLRHIGSVFQTPILFNRSIGENITFNQEYKSHIAKMDEVMEQVYMGDFIKSLPLGYDMLVGDLGDKLSAGQKQRIVLARALFKNSDFIILDEPTGSLDNISEKYIMDTVHKLKDKKTILIITHKLSILKEVDEVLVLKNGGICERGNHRRLLNQKGEYFRLYYADHNDQESICLVS